MALNRIEVALDESIITAVADTAARNGTGFNTELENIIGVGLKELAKIEAVVRTMCAEPPVEGRDFFRMPAPENNRY